MRLNILECGLLAAITPIYSAGDSRPNGLAIVAVDRPLPVLDYLRPRPGQLSDAVGVPWTLAGLLRSDGREFPKLGQQVVANQGVAPKVAPR